MISGDLPPGSRLAPERQLATQLGTSRLTLRAALLRLEVEGWVRSRQGSGVEVQDIEVTGGLGVVRHLVAGPAPQAVASASRLFLMLLSEAGAQAAQRDGRGALAERVRRCGRAAADADRVWAATVLIADDVALRLAIRDLPFRARAAHLSTAGWRAMSAFGDALIAGDAAGARRALGTWIAVAPLTVAVVE